MVVRDKTWKGDPRRESYPVRLVAMHALRAALGLVLMAVNLDCLWVCKGGDLWPPGKKI